MTNRRRQMKKAHSSTRRPSRNEENQVTVKEDPRSRQGQVLDLQNKIGNKATTRHLRPNPSSGAVTRPIQRKRDRGRTTPAEVQRQVHPWKDKPSSRWAIRSLASGEIAIGVGRLRLDFELKNKRSGEVYDAYYSGQVAGVAAGFSINMSPSWIHFGTAGKVKPSELDGLGAEVRSMGVSLGIIGFSMASMKLPNVDTSPSRIDLGGISASFGISASAFYSGGEFRVRKKPDRPTA